MKYEIVSADHIGLLEKKVQEKLDNGWELQGGVVCIVMPRDKVEILCVGTEYMFYQTIFKN